MARQDAVSQAATDDRALRLLHAIVRISDDAIFTCDDHSHITSWSIPAERLIGHSESDVLSEPLETLFPEHLRGEVRAVGMSVRAGDEVRHFETEMVRADGMPIPVSLSLCPVAGLHAGSAGYVVIARDVTEQVLAQATLAGVEARLRSAEALAHVGSWMWDRRTGVVQWSDEFHRIHGVDPLEFDGTLESYLAAITPEDRERMRDAMEASAAFGRALEEEYELAPPGEGARRVRVRAEPTIGSAGIAVGLWGVGQDITEEPAGRERSGES